MKHLLSTVYFLFKNYSLTEVVYPLIRCNKTTFFLWNTRNTDRNGVNKRNTHTHTKHLHKDHTGNGDPTMSPAVSEFLFVFRQCKRRKHWRHHFFELEICYYTETSSFLRKYNMLASSKSRGFHWMYPTFCRK